MKRYFSKMALWEKFDYIRCKNRPKIPRREQHKILVWYEKDEKRYNRHAQSERDKFGLPF